MDLTYENLVKFYLEKYPETRDDYKLLLVKIWKDQYATFNCDSIEDFLMKIASGDLKNADSISRARRRVQEEYPSLRGDTYAERQSKAQEYKLDSVEKKKVIQQGALDKPKTNTKPSTSSKRIL